MVRFSIFVAVVVVVADDVFTVVVAKFHCLQFALNLLNLADTNIIPELIVLLLNTTNELTLCLGVNK